MVKLDRNRLWKHHRLGGGGMGDTDGMAMRIAIVLHDFAGGGSERVAIRLANGWAAAGRSVTLLCGCDDGPLRSLVAGDVAVRVMTPAIVRGRGSRRRLGYAIADIVRSTIMRARARALALFEC